MGPSASWEMVSEIIKCRSWAIPLLFCLLFIPSLSVLFLSHDLPRFYYTLSASST